MSDWWGIVWLVVLLAFNAFFVAAEFAVISARRSQIEPKAEAGSKRAKTALYAIEHATLMLATSQLGITVCSLLILNVSEPAIHHLLEVPLHALGWDAAQVLAPLGDRATAWNDLDKMVQAIIQASQPGDAIVVMSNGSFGGIHQRLLDQLSR